MTNGPVFLLLLAVAGLLLSPAVELVIARGLPRLGEPPSLKVRITTAAVTALLFALLGWRFGFTAELPAFLLLALLGVQLSRIDFTLHLLPNPLVLLLLGGGFVLLAASAALAPAWSVRHKRRPCASVDCNLADASRKHPAPQFASACPMQIACCPPVVR